MTNDNGNENMTAKLLSQLAHRKDELYGAICRITETKTLEEAKKIANEAIVGETMKICANCVHCEKKGDSPYEWVCHQYIAKESINPCSGKLMPAFKIKMNCYSKNPSGNCYLFKGGQ